MQQRRATRAAGLSQRVDVESCRSSRRGRSVGAARHRATPANRPRSVATMWIGGSADADPAPHSHAEHRPSISAHGPAARTAASIRATSDDCKWANADMPGCTWRRICRSWSRVHPEREMCSGTSSARTNEPWGRANWASVVSFMLITDVREIGWTETALPGISLHGHEVSARLCPNSGQDRAEV